MRRNQLHPFWYCHGNHFDSIIIIIHVYYNFILFTYFILHNFTLFYTTFCMFTVHAKIFKWLQNLAYQSKIRGEPHKLFDFWAQFFLNTQFTNLKTLWNIQHAYSMPWQYCSWKLIMTTYILISQTHILSTCTCILKFLVIMYI